MESPQDGSAGNLQHDVHLLAGELEQDGPQCAAVEHLDTEPLIHGSKFEQVLEN